VLLTSGSRRSGLGRRSVPEKLDEAVVEDRLTAVVCAGRLLVAGERDEGCARVTLKFHLHNIISTQTINFNYPDNQMKGCMHLFSTKAEKNSTLIAYMASQSCKVANASSNRIWQP
jgi:hypothetical protein